MYCKKCAAEINESMKNCYSCGAATSVLPFQDSSMWGWSALGFFIPLVGLILFLVWRNEKPAEAKAAGMGALAAVIFWLSASILFGGLGMFGLFRTFLFFR